MTQWKDKSRNHWRYQFKYKGQRYGGRGLLSRDEAKAEEVAHKARLKKEAKKEASIRQIDGTAFKKVIYEYLDDAKLKFSSATHKYKVTTYKRFYEFLLKYVPGSTKGTDILIESIASKHVKDFLKTRPSANSWNTYRKDIGALFAYAIKHHYTDYNPIKDIDKLPHSAKRKGALTADMVTSMIEACDPENERPLFMVVLHSLGRIDEILRLTWADVNFDRRQFILWTRKRKGGTLESDVMPMNNEIFKTLEQLHNIRTQDEWVFFNAKTGTRYMHRPRFMKSLCKRVFAPECKSLKEYTGPAFGFHDLRHFMASFIAAQGKGSIKDYQRLLRHKEVRTTEIYLHQIGDNLRSLVEDAEVFKAGVPSGCDNKQNTHDK